MKPERDTPLQDISVVRLVAMLFTPCAMRYLLEELPTKSNRIERAKVQYRNSLLLFEHIDRHIIRSAIVVTACLFLQGFLSLFARQEGLVAIVSMVMLAAVVNAAYLGIYRQVLNERIDKCAKIAGLERPPHRDPVETFPPSQSDGTDSRYRDRSVEHRRPERDTGRRH